MRKFAPLEATHPLVTDATPCYVCGVPFAAGDEVTLVPMPPQDEEERAKAAAGRAYNAPAEVVHWRCRPEPEGS